MTTVSPTRPNPYVGPRAFQRGETLYGRDHEVLELLDLLIAERIVLLYSPSGAGKTSLIQAALIPELEQEGFQVLPPMRVSLESPHPAVQAANRYVFSLILSLEETLARDEQLPLDELATLTLSDYLDRRGAATDEAGSIVLIFDQFEEILTVDPTDEAAKSGFFEQVGQALRDRQRWALFAMREEFLAGLDPYLRPLPTRLSSTYRLELLGPGVALEAVQQPAHQAGVEFTPSTALKLVDDLRQVRIQRPDGSTEEQLGLYVEPVQLQVVCRRLWDRLPPNATRIVAKDLEAVGDVDTALAGYYAERVVAIAAETGVRERVIREWVDRHLITEQGIRGQVLQGPAQSQGLDNQAIWPLVDAHLVRAEKRRGATWFELAHDRLIGPVQANNTTWREAHLSPLQRQATLWEEQGRPGGLLLRDQALVEAEAGVSGGTGELTAVEREFLAACRETQERAERERRQARRIRWLAVGATIFGVVAVILTIFAWSQLQRADQERGKAVLSAQEAATAREQADQDRGKAVLAAQEAATLREQAEQERGKAALSAQEAATLREQADQERGKAALAAQEAAAAREQAEQQRRVAQMRALVAHSQSVFLDAPQRSLLLAVEATSNILQTGDPYVPAAEQALRDALGEVGGFPLTAHKVPVNSVAFSPGGRWLATGSDDDTARLWDLGAAGPLQAGVPAAESLVLRGHGRSVASVAFSPDGRWLATGSWDRTTRLWDLGAAGPLQAGEPTAEPLVLRGQESGVTSVAFSPDGRWLATGSDDHTVWLWDLGVGDPAAGHLVLRGHEDGVTSVAFSPDGRWLATGSDDDTARLWDLGAAGPLGAVDPAAGHLVLRGHEDGVTSVAFSPDGRWLATGSDDDTARLWDLGAAGPLQAVDPAAGHLVLRGHESGVTSVAFNPDGRWLATGSWDDTARLWDLGAAGPLGVGDPAARPLVLRGHEGGVTSVAFSPDGGWLATGSWDNTARLWDLGAAGPLGVGNLTVGPLVLPGIESSVTWVAFSPDGRWLATASEVLPGRAGVTTAQLWDLGAAGPRVLHGHEESVISVAFSPDGRWLATGSWDRTARLWDLQAGYLATRSLVLRGHGDAVSSVAFSPDGRWLATGSYDATVRLWDLGAAGPLGAGDPVTEALVLLEHNTGVHSVAFSPDGRWLATGSEVLPGSGGATAQLWDLGAAGPLQAVDPAAKPLVLRVHGGVVVSVAFSPDGRWLATASHDLTDSGVDTARLWDLQAGNPAANPLVLPGHESSVNSVAFSPDGRWLATASQDRITSGGATARLWDLQAGNPAAEPLVLRVHEEPVSSVAFSPAGRWLATGSADSTARLWDLDLDQLLARACRTAGRNMTREEWVRYMGADVPYRRTCPTLPEGE